MKNDKYKDCPTGRLNEKQEKSIQRVAGILLAIIILAWLVFQKFPANVAP